jgi:hypothetical protein
LELTSLIRSTLRARSIVALVATALPASLAAQQSQMGALQGTVTDAVRGHSIAAATVELSRVQPEPVVTFTARSDANGRYRVDSLPPGEYVLHLSTPLLDSLELALPERALSIAPGATARADFIVPRGAALRDAVCPGLTLGKGKAVVAGHAIDADTDRPLAGADLVVTWTELVVDSTLESRSQELSAAVRTGERGAYRLCGVPADTRLSLQLQQAGRASAAVDVTVTSEAGAEVRDLSLSTRSAATIAALDSLERLRGDAADTAGPLLLSGTASVTGIVRGATGLPLENTEIRVRGARSSAVSDAAGRYSIAALPAGTQTLVVRRIGYEPTEISVELRAGRSTQYDLKLTRAILLDSVRVVAMRSLYPEFEYNRRANPFGRYLGPDEVERRHATGAMGLLFGIPGLAGVGHNVNERVVSTRGARHCASMRIYLDGTEVDENIAGIQASQIGAVEVYVDGAFVPSRYAARGACGVVVFWSKSSRRITPPKPATAPASP